MLVCRVVSAAPERQSQRPSWFEQQQWPQPEWQHYQALPMHHRGRSTSHHQRGYGQWHRDRLLRWEVSLGCVVERNDVSGLRSNDCSSEGCTGKVSLQSVSGSTGGTFRINIRLQRVICRRPSCGFSSDIVGDSCREISVVPQLPQSVECVEQTRSAVDKCVGSSSNGSITVSYPCAIAEVRDVAVVGSASRTSKRALSAASAELRAAASSETVAVRSARLSRAHPDGHQGPHPRRRELQLHS